MSVDQKILAMMAGRDSTKPMRFDDLVEASGLLPDTLMTVLDQMANAIPASINRATITKGGHTQMMIWPTGMVSAAGSMFVISRGRMETSRDRPSVHTPASKLQKNVTELQESAAKVKPTASITSKENTMNQANRPSGSGKQPGALNKAIYDKIIGHPGITETALIKHVLQQLPGTTEKQVRKTMGNMRHVTKKIRTEGERGNLTYHLNTGTSQPAAKPASKVGTGKKVAVGKVIAGAEAASLRGDPPAVKTPASLPVVKQEAEPDFELLLSDENCLHINLGGEKFRLDPKQLARLDAFLGRVLPDGVRLADGARA